MGTIHSTPIPVVHKLDASCFKSNKVIPWTQSDIGSALSTTPSPSTTLHRGNTWKSFGQALLLRPYLEGYPFTTPTEHDSIKSILILSDRSGRLAWRRLCLSEFSFNVAHRAGIKRRAPDALSKLSVNGAHTTPLEDNLPFLAIETPGNMNTSIHFVNKISNVHNPLDEMHVFSNTSNGAVDTLTTPPNAKFIREQAKYTYWRALTLQVRLTNIELHIDHHGLLVSRSTIDGAI